MLPARGRGDEAFVGGGRKELGQQTVAVRDRLGGERLGVLSADALQRVADGTYSQSDLDLIRKYPEVADQVPDPDDPGEADVTQTKPTAAITEGVSCGWWVDVWFRRRSLLGSTIYVYHHYVQYCLNYGWGITRWPGASPRAPLPPPRRRDRARGRA